MKHTGALVRAEPGWSRGLLERLQPGSHVIVLIVYDGDRSSVAYEARADGFQLRDTLAICVPERIVLGLLLRVPPDGTAVTNMMKHGAGGLNIDATRIRWKSEAERTAARPGSMPKANESVGTFQTRDRSQELPADFQSRIGRWPSNIVFVHHPECKLTGERRIPGHKGYPNGPGGSSSQFSQKGMKTTRSFAWEGYADADGNEVIPEWKCVPTCPVHVMDVSTYDLLRETGASRYYPQFQNWDELIEWFRLLLTQPGSALLEEL